jgi:carbon storage regulator
MIGDDIEITIVDIRGEKVRLGINAPPHVPVHRKEVYEAIKREKQARADASGGVPGKVDSLANKKPQTS